MQILVEPSDYILRNAGDMAMQEVTIARLAELWPQARLLVLSEVPDQFPVLTPNMQAISMEGRATWLAGRSCPPDVLHDGVLPAGALSIPETNLGLMPYPAHSESALASEFVRLVSTSDLVIAGGMGGITDAFPWYAEELLNTLALAISRGVPTALMGQGIGPLTDDRLLTRAAAVLPHVRLIALREHLAGGPLLKSLGVSAHRIVTTGDDAIELAYDPERTAGGSGLGVNVRAASYSELNTDLLTVVREVVQTSAYRFGASLVSVPISRVPGEEDEVSNRFLLSGYSGSTIAAPAIHTAATVVDQIHHCRVLVTGSYHAGVFALATGRPVVALARSAYYVDKFLGLADQFGVGCQLVRLRRDFRDELTNAISQAWTSADEVREPLLRAAACQLEESRKAYRQLQRIVNHPRA